MSPSEPLLNEIRAARPVAPTELRERVRLVAAQEPSPEPLLARLPRRLDLRRFLLVGTPATLAVAVVAAGVIGLTRPDERTDPRAGSAASVGDALALLWQECPGARDRVLTERGRVRPHVNIFVDGLNVRYAGGLEAPVRDNAEIIIVPAVSGGER